MENILECAISMSSTGTTCQDNTDEVQPRLSVGEDDEIVGATLAVAH